MIHPTSEIQTQHIGEGTSVWQYCIILKGARIGDNCNINCHVFIENDVTVGNNVTVKPGVQLWDGVHLEDDVFVGPNATFTNDIAPRSKYYPDFLLKTIVRKGASIGANTTILAGVTIGQYAMVGAGSVVTKSVPDYTIWYGNPAVFMGFICQCGHRLKEKHTCDNCGKIYTLNKGGATLND